MLIIFLHRFSRLMVTKRTNCVESMQQFALVLIFQQMMGWNLTFLLHHEGCVHGDVEMTAAIQVVILATAKKDNLT